MATGWWLVSAAGVGIVIANLRTMRPLWASPALERSQKIAQTVLMWLVPGSYLAVRAAITTSAALPSGDPTVPRSGLADYVDWAAADNYRHDHTFDGGGGGHHGGGGGHGDGHGGDGH